jgi:hypothetical protein
MSPSPRPSNPRINVLDLVWDCCWIGRDVDRGRCGIVVDMGWRGVVVVLLNVFERGVKRQEHGLPG